MNAPINNTLFPTREAYLTEAANLALDDLIMPIVDQWHVKKGFIEYDRPNFRISVGFPKHSRGGKAVAVCFVTEASTDHVNEIFINPEIDDPYEVLEHMIHELCHAVDNCASGHQNFFAFVARKVGLEGKLTATFAGDALRASLKEYVDLLGNFPHHKMVSDRVHKKDSTRQLKVECWSTDCNFMFRTSAKQIEKLGLPGSSTCPACSRGKLVWV